MKNSNKKVYVGLAADILHEGHIKILKIASKIGDVTVGLLTDKAIASYKRLPHLNYKQREIILKNIKYVKKVIKQESLDYTKNLQLLKPHYVVHGDDWKYGIQKKTRANVIRTLNKWSGKLIEPQYTKNISSSRIIKQIQKIATSPDNKVKKLRRLINSKELVRIIETHNPITSLIAENFKIIKKNKYLEFDGFWSSSLADSIVKGKPDNQSVDYSTRISAINDILDITSKPLLFDADNGGRIEHIPYMIKSLEKSGVSGVIIEDKIGLKINSLFKNQEKSQQDTVSNFCKKIIAAKSVKISDDFMIIARIESLILKKGIKDSIKRAEKYSKAGADAILIHSNKENPNEIFKFAKIFIKSKFAKPLIAIPSTYSKTYEKDLIKNHFKIVIYANHLIRAIYPAVEKVLKSILKNERAYEAEKFITSINKIIHLIK